jgi:hypothetical protein
MLFRLFLVFVSVFVTVYTSFVINDHGWNLFPVFFGDILNMSWPGQFNLDFACFILLSCLWIAWRHKFSTIGIALGLLVIIGGSPYLATYILVESFRSNGDITSLLLGKNRPPAIE